MSKPGKPQGRLENHSRTEDRSAEEIRIGHYSQRSEDVAYQSTQMTPEEIHDLWKTFKKDQSDESLLNKLI